MIPPAGQIRRCRPFDVYYAELASGSRYRRAVQRGKWLGASRKLGEPSIRTVSESNEVAPSRPRPSTGKMRPQRRLTQADLDSFLEKAADLLRGGVDHSEFRGYVFALL